jgi:hypothetical protein
MDWITKVYQASVIANLKTNPNIDVYMPVFYFISFYKYFFNIFLKNPAMVAGYWTTFRTIPSS